MIPNQPNQKERKPETKSKMKKAYLVMPLIIVLMLVCVIPTIILISANVGHQTETAELDKVAEQEEEISAAVVTGGSSITIEENGIYLIKLHGGSGATKVINAGKDNEETVYGSNGSLTTGYIYLSRGDVLTTKVYKGGAAANATYSTKGGQGISVSLGTTRLGYVSGGPGSNMVGDRGYCSACKSDEDSTTWTSGTYSDFVNKVNTGSTASGGTTKTWTTYSSLTDVTCGKNSEKSGTWSNQYAYQYGGRRRQCTSWWNW